MKSKIIKGVAIAATAILAGGTLAGCVSNEKFTLEEVEAKIVEAKESVVCSPCECEPLICECETCETCEVCEVCSEPVDVEVEVDNGNLALVLDHIFDNGDVSYLTYDLDDDEVDEIVDRIVFVNDIKELAIKEVKDEGVDELDKENIVINSTSGENVTLDDRDIKRFRLYDDSDEIMIDEVEFDDGDASVYIDTKFKYEEEMYYARFLIEFEDGEVDDITVCSTATSKAGLSN